MLTSNQTFSQFVPNACTSPIWALALGIRGSLPHTQYGCQDLLIEMIIMSLAAAPASQPVCSSPAPFRPWRTDLHPSENDLSLRLTRYDGV